MELGLFARSRRALARWLWSGVAGDTGAPEVNVRDAGLLAITDNLPALICQFDPHGNVLFANAAMRARLILSYEELLGRHISTALSAQTYGALKTHFDQALTGEGFTFEFAVAVDGIQRYYACNFVPEIDPHGKLLSVFSIWQDVTERRAIELRHAAGEQRLRVITDNLPVLIAYVDRELHFEFCNATFTEWTGMRPDDLVGRSLMDVIDVTDPSRAEVVKPFLSRALAGERVEFELQPTPGRNDRWLQLNFIPETDGTGQVAGLYLLSTDVTHLKQAQQELANMARFDALTGLPNRLHLDEKLEEAARRSSRNGRPMGVAFLDIDYFKQINDTLGHAVGDQVLREFSRRLLSCVRQTDVVARLGGDEFLIVLEDVSDSAMLGIVGAKIVEAMKPPFMLSSGALRVSSSIGLAFAAGARIVTADLLECADIALYQAKREGRATYRLKPYDGTASSKEHGHIPA
ncbi:diguanylate cyclase domain-containing protein [Massilia putida]|uniref:diguanylate cyclase domain-containing protein n=1 Tax=Massilia putida TaxID=1141883 RepID=UPI000951F629|nr:diguanylate cyclase [Massilia putida]